MALPAAASTDPFGTAENYNGFIFENVLHNGGDCEGAFAVGGNSILSNFGAGSSLPSGGNTAGIGMVVKGNSSWTYGQVFQGNMHVGGTVSHTGVSIVNGVLYNPSTPINFSVEETYLKSLSAYWASLPATSGTTVTLQPWGRLDLTGNNSTLNVFFVSNTQWVSTGEVNLVVPAGSSVIINVEGASDSIPHTSPGYFGNMNFNGNNGASAWQTTVWNFYNMTNMSMSSFGWKGSLLAPYANFTYANGNLEGNLIAKSLIMTGLAGGAELHLYPFNGNVPVPAKQVPAYIISKAVKDVAGQGPSGKAAKAGDVISYIVNVSNVGNVNLTNVTLNDSLVNLTGPAGDIAPLKVLNPGEVWSYSGNYTVTQKDINSNGGGNGLIENTATVNCTQLAPKSQTAEVSVKATPAYIIDKEVINVAGQGPLGNATKAGDIISYNVNVSNVGNVDLTNITLNDSLVNLIGPTGDNAPLNVLNPGETWRYSGNYTVTQTNINSNGGGNGLIENTATVDCTQLDPKSHSAEVPVKKISAYAISKVVTDVAGKGSTGVVIAAGNVIKYRINVSNTGNADLSNVTVNDSLINLTGPTESKTTDRVLNPGENWTYTGNYSAIQADMDSNGGGNGLIENTARVSCDQLGPKSQTAEVPVKATPAYIISKTVKDVAGQGPSGKATKVGDVISYKINVSNVGNVDLTNVTLNDSLINLTGPTGDNAPLKILNPEEVWSYSGNYSVTQKDINSNGGGNGLIENTATVNCTQLAPKSQTAEVSVKATPAYIIDKEVINVAGQGPLGNATKAGDVVSYKVNVSNVGNVDLTNITLNDSLVNLTGPTGDNAPLNVLNPGETWRYSGNYTVTQTDINSNGGGNGLIENTASVNCTQLDPKSHSTEVPVKKTSAYSISKVVTDVAGKGSTGVVIAAGNVIKYRINVSNTGNADLSNVTVNDSLINLTGPTESKLTDGILNPGENWTHTGNYSAIQADIDSNGGGNGLIENTARVSCDQLGPKSQTAEVPVKATPAYIIDKAVTDVARNGPAGKATKAGDIISYRVNVSNVGNTDLTNVNVSDPLINLTGPMESKATEGVLEIGENWLYSGNYTVTQIDLDNNGTQGEGLINNTATVDCDQLGPKSHSAEASLNQTAAYTIDKTVTDVAGKGPSGVATAAGDTINYIVKVSNVGNIDLTDINVTDSLINLTGPAQSITENEILEVGEDWTYTGNYTISQEDINSNGGGDGLIENTATVECEQLGQKSHTAEVPVNRVPAYSIEKVATDVAGKGPNGIPTLEGDIISYRINVTNTGNTDITTVNVTDSLLNLPEPLESKTADKVLEVGENWTYNVNYTVTQGDLDSRGGGDDLIENTATVECDQLGPRSGTVDVPLLGSPAYAIEKEATDVAGKGPEGTVTKAGDIISYQIYVNNAGNMQLHNVTVTDSLINLSEPIESITANGLMEEGEIWTYTGNYTVTQEDLSSNGGGDGLIENNATVQSEELNPKSDTSEVAIEATPIYIISKEVIDVAGQGPTGKVTKSGDIISYSIDVSNNGNVNLTNITLNDSLINLTGPSGDLDPLGVLNPDETWTYAGNYTVSQADINSNGRGDGLIENTATVDCDQLEPKSYTAEAPVTRTPAYTIDKNVVDVAGKGPSGIPTLEGDVIHYRVNVTNTGNTDLTDINFTESMANFSNPLESKTTDGTLEAGENWTYFVNYTITKRDLDNKSRENDLLENTATVECDQLGPRSGTVDVPLLGSPAYIIDKEVTDVAGKGPEGTVTKAGDIISYQINVTNAGNLQLHNVTVNDSLINLSEPIESITADGLLEEGEVWTYSGNYTVTQEDIESNGGGKGLIENIASVRAEELEPKSHTTEVPIEATPVYTLNKIVADVAGKGPDGIASRAGDIISYRINVSNAGNVNLTNITLNDTLINLEDPAGDETYPGVLNPEETWTYTGNYTVTQHDINSNGGGTGVIKNTVTVDCDQLEPKPYSAEASLGIPVYTIEKTITGVAGKGPAGTVTAPGDMITYQVTVSNVGNIDLTNVTVNDSLISLTGPTGDDISPGILNPNEIWTYTGNYSVTQNDINNNGTTENGFIRNTATVDCDELDPQNTAVQAPIERNPSYSIFKSAIGVDEEGDCIINEPRDEINFRIVVENEGNVDLTNVTVGDPSVTLTGPIGDDIDPDELNPGEVWVYLGNYSVTRADMENESGNISNTATVSCNELPEKSSTVNLPIDKKVELSIYKSFIGIDETGNYMVDRPGDVIQYQVAVKNKGNIALTGVSVNDPMVTLIKLEGDYTDSGILNPGELWVFTANYTVTQEDIDTNGNGTGLITNTATINCNELPRESSSIELPIIRILNTGMDSENNNKTDVSSLAADFTTNVSSGNAPLTVKFTDKSTGSPGTWSWDFNNDGAAESNEVNPVYTYINPGTYTVKLTVRNANGSSSKPETITVLQKTSSNIGGSGGSSSERSSGESIGEATVVSINSSTTTTPASPNTTQTETTTLNAVQSSTPAKTEPTPIQTATGTTEKEGKKTPGFEAIFEITALLVVFLCRWKLKMK